LTAFIVYGKTGACKEPSGEFAKSEERFLFLALAFPLNHDEKHVRGYGYNANRHRRCGINQEA